MICLPPQGTPPNTAAGTAHSAHSIQLCCHTASFCAQLLYPAQPSAAPAVMDAALISDHVLQSIYIYMYILRMLILCAAALLGYKCMIRYDTI